jgi:hypothetical protein
MSAEFFEDNVREMLKGRLLTVAGIGSEALSIGGREYRPTVGTPYIRETLNFIAETPISNGLISHRMVWNLAFNFPNGRGMRAAGQMRGRTIESFRPGLKLDANGDTLVVMETARKGAVESTDWVTLPLEIVLQTWTLG